MTSEFWIARDATRNLLPLFQDSAPIWTAFERHSGEDEYYWLGNCIAVLDPNLFPELTFENSPQKVKLTLVKEE